ncbi:unnamed protein product, partial [Rotaria magnacalcarata]
CVIDGFVYAELSVHDLPSEDLPPEDSLSVD